MTAATPRRVATRTAFACRWLTVREQVVTDGASTSSWFHLDHPGCALVVPVTADGRVAFVRVWRPSVDRWCRELPAGRIDGGEDPATAARRELREEIGGDCAHIQRLGSVYASTGSSNEAVHLFLATGVRLGDPVPDPHEWLSTELVPIETALEHATSGSVHDGPSALALLWAATTGNLRRLENHA